MDMLVRAAGIVILAVILCAVLKKENPAMAVLLCLGAVCAVLAAAAEQISAVVTAAEEMAEKVRQLTPDVRLRICQHEPFSGAHVGPGMLALFFKGKER